MKNSSPPLFVGLDVSTQGCKLVAIDTGASRVVHVDSLNYDTDLPEFGTRNGVVQGRAEGVSESDPKMWVEAVNRLLDRLSRSGVPTESIRAMAVSGQQHGLVALDAEGRLSRPYSKLWNDFSTAEECALLTEKVGGQAAMIHEVGNSQRTGYTAAKILHFLREDPEAFHRTRTFFLVHNYINWYLTGGVRVMEPGDASGMALWHPGRRAWSKKVLDAIHPSLEDKLPEIRSSTESIGVIAPQLAARFGFSADCLVGAGSGDNMCGALGTGNVRPGVVTVSLGTSGTAYAFSETPFIDPEGEIAAFCDATGHYLPLLCVSNMAGGYNVVLKKYGLSHEAFNNLLHKTRPGNGGRILLPWYEGERTPDLPQAAPLCFGFGLDDFVPELLCRAVLEGAVLNLQAGFGRMPVRVDELRVTGGLSKSPAWCQMLADVFEAQVVPIHGEGAALGAALHAAWTWGMETGEGSALEPLVAAFVKTDAVERFTPIPENVPVYRLQKRLFAALSARIRGLEGEDPFALRQGLL